MAATIPCHPMTTAPPPRPAPARTRHRRAPRPGRRLETWLWTGPLGHLIGGTLDFGQALARYLLARIHGRPVR
jgi:hypothetical protein